ncbi:MAG: response regulator [Janthinobacterium lividum]
MKLFRQPQPHAASRNSALERIPTDAALWRTASTRAMLDLGGGRPAAESATRRWFSLHAQASSRMSAAKITRLMVVDDNIDIRFAMYECLSAEGYDVAIAGDGLRALELAKLVQPQAILLDLGMPALDGFSTARALRRVASLAQVPMIAVTGFFEKEHFETARASGFDFYFQKPVEIDALLGLLRGELAE